MVNTVQPRWSAGLPQSIQREMDQVFGHFFGEGNGNGQSAARAIAPAALWEEENRWCVEIDLPGVKQEDIDVTLEKNALRLTAERKAPHDTRFFHQERPYGKFERLITLPETVDPEGIQAELKDGVLRLSLTKRPELQPKKIQVKAS